MRAAKTWVILLSLALILGACSRDEVAPMGHASLAAPGQWLIVNYWAEWCRPCIEEIPELSAFAASHETQARVLLVNFDRVQQPELGEQAARLGIPAELLLEEDPARTLGLPRSQVLPSTFVIDPEGTLRVVLKGAQTEAKLAAIIGGP